MLSQLSRQRGAVSGIELVLLEEHVEYWNDQGWRDRFSAPVYTQRQYDYERQLHLATAYTPQIVIDGHLQGSGGNASAIKQMIADSAKTPKSAKVALEFLAPDKLQVSVTEPDSAKLNVFLAVTEDNLTTNVGGGENDGRKLHHDAVSRQLQLIGAVSDGRFEKTVNVPAKNDWKLQDLRAIVFVQDGATGQIRGAADLPFRADRQTVSGR